jgi:hypothetical protein
VDIAIPLKASQGVSAGQEDSNTGTPNTAPGSPTSPGSPPSAPVLHAVSGSQTSQPVLNIDVNALAQSLASFITQAVASPTVSAPPPITNPLQNPVAPAVPTLLPPRNSSIPKINDLPKFKGFGIDGSDATSFIFALEDLFDLHQVQSAHRVILVGQTFPHSTPALAWYQSARAAATFEKNGILNWDTFKDIFIQKFQTPQSRRLALLDSYDRFLQRGTVTDHQLRFDRLCMQLEHVEFLLVIAYSASNAAACTVSMVSGSSEYFNSTLFLSSGLSDLRYLLAVKLSARVTPRASLCTSSN